MEDNMLAGLVVFAIATLLCVVIWSTILSKPITLNEELEEIVEGRPTKKEEVALVNKYGRWSVVYKAGTKCTKVGWSESIASDSNIESCKSL